MPWNKSGDTGATYPALMRVAGMREADPRSVNEVAGFFWRLTNLSSAHMTDHVIDAGTLSMIAGANELTLVKLAVRAGLLTKIRVDGLAAYKLLDDPEFVHIRTRAEIEWARQQKADTNDLRLSVPIRLRDGDLCRYCQVVVTWAGRMSARRGTLDHLNPGESGTVKTMVVACTACNSELRDRDGEDREQLRPPPKVPFYSPTTARWLTKNGHPTMPTEMGDERPDSQPDHARSDPAASGITRTADSDPGKPGPRAADTTRANNDASGNDLPNMHSPPISQPEGMHSSGSGRDGTGNARSSTNGNSAARTRKRSTRGRSANGRA